jgi:hypothetical protein
MPKGSGYSGKQGESGKKPAGIGTKQGAYGYSANYVNDTATPNMQSWPANEAGPMRGAGKSGGGGMKRSSGSSDY